MLTRLRETGRFIKEHAKPRAMSILAWLRSAWQAIRGEMLRTWQNLKPLRLPAGWQARALLGVFLLTILIPGITRHFTRPALPPPAAKPLPVTVRADETNLLARLVAAEAEDEPYPGQVAVVAVVLNRLRDPAFPKTIPDIIFEPWAFESVANGHYWEVQVRPRDYAATQDALNDWDPSNGALYFFNPATATSAWIWTRPQITQIGNHIFTR
ncbi:cell wall hydrolase [Neomoorella mulderi]|uniref:cell wall hydrolase n=1 Tax=Neomoorella mulderi TaxID=202604 RepID=UPI001F1CB2A7|nr:cell wall hydrolase [Moorella mulderi]